MVSFLRRTKVKILSEEKDYKEGTKIMLGLGKEYGVNIRKYQWLCRMNKLLSRKLSCQKFWANCKEQKMYGSNFVEKLWMCKTASDIFHRDTTAFLWDNTKEGFGYWEAIDEEFFGEIKLENL